MTDFSKVFRIAFFFSSLDHGFLNFPFIYPCLQGIFLFLHHFSYEKSRNCPNQQIQIFYAYQLFT